MSRCHIHLPIIDSSGVVFPYASITLNDAATGTILAGDVFVQPEGGNPISFPLFTDPAVVDLWLDEPARVQIVAEVSDNVRIVLDGIDILPPADRMVTAPRRLAITGADNIGPTAVLMYGDDGQAVFRVADPVGTHQHEGDSAGSVVLTGEPPTDFNPYQTWVGYQAGRDTAPSSSGSSAFGAHAEVDGASSLVMGQGAIVPHVSTGVRGSMTTYLSSQDGEVAAGSTVAGGGNLTAEGRNMTVLGSLTDVPTGSVPDNATVIGSGNIIGAQGAVKVGPNHPASTAGPNHTTIGPGNSAQTSGLPWAGAQTPYTIGGSTVSLGGDPSDSVSASDWFGGTGPLALGQSVTTWNPSIGLLQGNAVTRTALRAVGNVVANGQRTWSNATTTLGFYGAVGDVRKSITKDPGDYTRPLLDQVLQVLAQTGLIYTTTVPVVTESGTHADGAKLEFAETGQALQWKLPPTSPDYRAANAFTIASNKIVLNAANGPFPTRGVPALYSAGLSDVSVRGRFVYNATGTNLISNPEFETNTTGWSGWDSGTVLARDTTQMKFGLASLKITPSGTKDYNRAGFSVAVTGGTNVNWSAHVRPTANYPIGVIIEWFSSGSAYISSTSSSQTAPLNTWTRLSVGGVAPVGAATGVVTVGYCTTNGSFVPASAVMNVDGMMLSTGSQTLQPYVDNTGYHPQDDTTGLMVRCLHEKSTVGGQPVATTKGYLVGRRYVYSVTGNTISSTVATHSTPVASGALLQADCSGTSVVIRANGTQISTFTDSTYTTRVKFGYRVCDSTQASEFTVLPFGF